MTEKLASPPVVKTVRPSVPTPTIRISEPTEKRIPLPNVTPPPPPADSMPPLPTSGRTTSTIPPPPLPAKTAAAAPMDGSANLTDTLIVHAAKQLNLPDMVHGPLIVGPNTAALVREVISNEVDTKVDDGEIPSGHLPHHIKGRVFRRAVDIGPIGAKIQDPSVQKIRILSPAQFSVFTKGKWQKVQERYADKEALIAAAERFAAGRIPPSAATLKSVRFYTEEGYIVHISLSKESPFIVVDKTPVSPTNDVLGEAERHVIQEAVHNGTRILVIGPSPAARRAVCSRLLEALPASAFVAVTGEPLPPSPTGGARVATDLTPVAIRSRDEVRAALSDLISMEPDWAIATGIPMVNLADLVAAASSRTSFITETSLAAEKPLPAEFAAALGASGISVEETIAARLLTHSFDLVIVADCAHEENLYVKSILAPAVQEDGTWMPKILFRRELTA